MVEEWRQATIEQILTKPQLKELKRLIIENKKKGLKPLDTEYTNSLKELFKKYEKDLLAKEILPDYLAYAVAHLISKNQEVFLAKLKQVI